MLVWNLNVQPSVSYFCIAIKLYIHMSAISDYTFDSFVPGREPIWAHLHITERKLKGEDECAGSPFRDKIHCRD